MIFRKYFCWQIYGTQLTKNRQLQNQRSQDEDATKK